jgi:hypothetical protein
LPTQTTRAAAEVPTAERTLQGARRMGAWTRWREWFDIALAEAAGE